MWISREVIYSQREFRQSYTPAGHFSEISGAYMCGHRGQFYLPWLSVLANVGGSGSMDGLCVHSETNGVPP